MRIEEEIKQPKFKNDYEKLSINLLITKSWIESFLNDFFKNEEITIQQFNILRILRGSNPQPLSTMQIRERMIDKMSDTSRIVDRLLVKKLVSKKISAKDNRLVDIKITAKGLAVLSRLDHLADATAKRFSNITIGEAKTINALLDKLREN